MCKWLKALFIRHPVAQLPSEGHSTPTRPAEQPPLNPQLVLVLPHPEEDMNPDATIENVRIYTVLNQWLTDWRVPSQFWVYWRNKNCDYFKITANYYR